jgi:single-strand DNA-binding protein
MNELQITVVGNVAQDLRHVTTEQGVPITTFRMASTRRQYDRAAGRWADGETTFVNVTCWRTLADNVKASVSKGDPVVVIGRLRIRAWEREGYKGNAVEIEATAVGHDLARGTSAFRRSQPRASVAPPEREVADDLLVSMETASGPGRKGDGDDARQAPDAVRTGGAESPSNMSGKRQDAAA